MASINAFLDLADGAVDTGIPLRTSLRFVRRRKAAASDAERRERVLILAGIVFAHVLFALLLRGAMKPWFPPRGRDTPLMITFIIRRPSVVVPQLIRIASPAALPPLVSVQPPPRHARTPAVPPAATRVVAAPDALQAVVVPPTGAKPAPLVLYDADGALRVPAAAAPAGKRDLLSKRNYSYMLPGAPRADSPDFHVTPGRSPQDVVNTGGRILSGLIGGVAQRPDGNGAYVATADRGLRISGRDTDPCEDIALDRADVDPDDAKVREQAEERWERSCVGK